MTELRGGSCECGALKYQISCEPKAVVVCHCSSCQRQSGSAFGMSMVLAADQFHVVSGELNSFDRSADSGAVMRCYFCPECGTRIYHQKPIALGIVILKPGTLDDPKWIKPARQLWTSCKQEWVELQNISSFERQPG
jgi:hypothetical protein